MIATALIPIWNLRPQPSQDRGRTRRATEWRLESVARVIKQNAVPPAAKLA